MSTLRVGAVVIVAAIVVAAWMLTRSPAPDYRTTVVRTGTVEATLESVGTIAPVNQVGLAFDTSGAVGAVDVSVGSTVTAGQTVASLDPTQLNASVVSARATLASAQATLAAAEASQSAPAASGGAISPTTTTTPAPSSRSGQSSPDAQQVAKLQATLLTDQAQEDADSSSASQSLAAATGVCDAAPSGGSPPAPGSPAPAGSPPTTTGTGAPITCSQALAQASAAQGKVTADITQVTHDESALNAALEPVSGGAVSAAAQGAPVAATTAFASSSANAASDVAGAGASPTGSAPSGGSLSGGGSSRSGGRPRRPSSSLSTRPRSTPPRPN